MLEKSKGAKTSLLLKSTVACDKIPQGLVFSVMILYVLYLSVVVSFFNSYQSRLGSDLFRV
jgi:hypothetical protein